MTATPTLTPPRGSRAPGGATTLGAIRRAHDHGTATDAPPRPIVVGRGLPNLAQPVDFAHLDGADVSAIWSGEWIKPGAGLDDEAAKLDELRQRAYEARDCFHALEADLRTEAKRAAMLAEGAKRERVDPLKLAAERERDAFRADLLVLRHADALLGTLRASIDARHDELRDERVVARAEADELHARADAAAARAQELESVDRWWLGQRALVNDQGRRVGIMSWTAARALVASPEPSAERVEMIRAFAKRGSSGLPPGEGGV